MVGSLEELRKNYRERIGTQGSTKKLSNEDVERIASAVVEKAAEDVGIRDIMIGSAMGKGAIPLYGRETRKEPCSCCLIDPEGPNAPENRMCTTKQAIGVLSNSEERAWCSEINIVSDGRCARARTIREAARECKEKYPEDTEAFFRCYIPAFSQITKGSNPGASEPPKRLLVLKEILATKTVEEAIILRGKYRDVWLSPDDVAAIDRHLSKLKSESNPGGEPRSKYYYCANTHLHPNNEVLQIKTLQDNPKCPYCGAIMTYGRYWGPLLATQKEYVTTPVKQPSKQER